MQSKVTAILLMCVFSANAFADVPESVGDYTDTGRLFFHGNSPFDHSQMREAVESDFELQVAGTPSAPLGEYLGTLQRRLRDGFQHAGFDNPEVTATPDEKTKSIDVTLNLGRRWKPGKVIVDGTTTLPVNDLIDRLTHPQPATRFNTIADETGISVSSVPGPDPTPPQYADWEKSDCAPFDNRAAGRFTNAVRRHLAQLGYLHPFLHVSVQPGDGVADLVVHFIDEGPRAKLHQINFDHLTLNDPEDVRNLLKLKPGDPVNLDLIEDLQKQLWDSGRFVSDTIAVEPLVSDPSQVNLKITVREAEGVPPLNQPLNDLQQSVLKLRNWFLTAGDDGSDVAVNLSYPNMPEFQAIWGGHRGAAIKVSVPAGLSMWSKWFADDADLTALLTKETTAICLPGAGIKWEGRIDPSAWLVNLSFDASDDYPKQIFQINVSADVNSDRGGTPAQGIAVDPWIPPVAFVLLATTSHDLKFDGDELVIHRAGVEIRSDKSTGRLIQISKKDATGRQVILTKTQPGLLAQLQKSAAASPGANLAIRDHPAGSTVSFFISAVLHSGLIQPATDRLQLSRIAGKIFTTKLICDLGDGVQSIFPWDNRDDSFDLPADTDFSQPSGFPMLVANAGLHFNTRFFTTRSWPATLIRCACMRVAGHPEVVGPELNRIYLDPDTGPLACLVMSEALHSAGVTGSKEFAQRGLDRFTAKAFAADCDQLFDRQPYTTSILTELAENLASLSDADLATISGHLPPTAAGVVLALVHQLRTTPAPMSPGNLRSAVEKTWTPELADQVKTALEKLAG